jgi:hypothetical protein
VAANEATSSTYITGGQLAQTWNYRPDLITLTIGEENNTIVKPRHRLLRQDQGPRLQRRQRLRGHHPRQLVPLDQPEPEPTTIQQQYRVIMAGRPKLMVAVTGYPNPYPKSTDTIAKIAELCVPLIDTIPTCTAALGAAPARAGGHRPGLQEAQHHDRERGQAVRDRLGGRFVFVDTYTKTRDHCMKMEVTIKTMVEHPEEEGACTSTTRRR